MQHAIFESLDLELSGSNELVDIELSISESLIGGLDIDSSSIKHLLALSNAIASRWRILPLLTRPFDGEGLSSACLRHLEWPRGRNEKIVLGIQGA